jgi:adenylosuccinate synthase
MAIRTFPIRVGNTLDGYSGGWYPDQTEITWDELGVKPEYTTVTKRIRRVATFSWGQFDDALHANDPDFVFINFLNYLDKESQYDFIKSLEDKCYNYDKYFSLIGGYGPTSGDIGIIG